MFKLGKLAPKHDVRTLQLSNYLDKKAVLPQIPASVNWTKNLRTSFPMFSNDSIGDCAIAGPAHLKQVWTANDGALVTPSESSVIDGYQKVGGYVPGNPSTDNGCILLDVMNYWRRTGLFGSKITAYAKVDHTDLDLVRVAIYLFGGVVLGIALPAAVQSQDNSETWKGPAHVPQVGPWSPGSWGGHCVIACDYSKGLLPVVTWGAVKPMTEQFFLDYCDECYVALSRDWVGGDGKAPNGFDVFALRKDLAAL